MSDCLLLPSCSLFMLQHLTEKCAVALHAHVVLPSNNSVSGQAKFPWHHAQYGVEVFYCQLFGGKTCSFYLYPRHLLTHSVY